MASQFQSQVLENGQWVTRTSNVNDVLSKPATKPAKQKQPPPQCGIMTRTLIESPVAHWILPVRLRSPQHNDIAIVGVSTAFCLSSPRHPSPMPLHDIEIASMNRQPTDRLHFGRWRANNFTSQRITTCKFQNFKMTCSSTASRRRGISGPVFATPRSLALSIAMTLTPAGFRLAEVTGNSTMILT